MTACRPPWRWARRRCSGSAARAGCGSTPRRASAAPLSASGFIDVAGLTLPVKKAPRRRVRVGGGGVVLTYTLERVATGAPRAARCGAGGRCACASRWWPPTWPATRAAAAAPRIRLRAGPGRVARPARRTPSPATRTATRSATRSTTARRSRTAARSTPTRDGQGDACDADDDDDGVLDVDRQLPRRPTTPARRTATATATATPARRWTATATASIDDDDNCDRPSTTPTSPDLDGDDEGDACDRDDDGDRFDDAYDNCPTVYNLEPSDVNGDGLINDQLDRDGDGIGTACDADEPVIQGARPRQRRPAPAAAQRWASPRRHELDAVRAGLVVRLRCSEACADHRGPGARPPHGAATGPAPVAHPGQRLGAARGRRHHLRVPALRPARAARAGRSARHSRAAHDRGGRRGRQPPRRRRVRSCSAADPSLGLHCHAGCG